MQTVNWYTYLYPYLYRPNRIAKISRTNGWVNNFDLVSMLIWNRIRNYIRKGQQTFKILFNVYVLRVYMHFMAVQCACAFNSNECETQNDHLSFLHCNYIYIRILDCIVQCAIIIVSKMHFTIRFNCVASCSQCAFHFKIPRWRMERDRNRFTNLYVNESEVQFTKWRMIFFVIWWNALHHQCVNKFVKNISKSNWMDNIILFFFFFFSIETRKVHSNTTINSQQKTILPIRSMAKDYIYVLDTHL